MLIVDDEPLCVNALTRMLRTPSTTLLETTSSTDALKIVQEKRPTVVLSDMRMPGMSGIDLLSEIKRLQPETSVVMMSGSATAAEAAAAVKRGAFDFLEKPYPDIDALREILRSAAAATQGKRGADVSHSPIIGTSRAMQRLRESIRAMASSDATSLIIGESGTGKELVARAIHDQSQRKDKPFIAVNCASLSESLIESELFGHERGAFTGANTQRKGLFEAAQGGTIFLDEIGDISHSTQVSLLRVLQQREIRRVGATDNIPIDVRVLAATNADLQRKVDEKAFRLDLFYRLNVLPVVLPPLRERDEDVELLAHHLVQRFAEKLGKKIEGFSPAALQTLRQYDWPGNVRELENVMQRTAVMTAGSIVERIDALTVARTNHAIGSEAAKQQEILLANPETQRYASQREGVLEHFNRKYLEMLLDQSKGNLSEASRVSGIDRSNLRRMLRDHQLR